MGSSTRPPGDTICGSTSSDVPDVPATNACRCSNASASTNNNKRTTRYDHNDHHDREKSCSYSISYRSAYAYAYASTVRGSSLSCCILPVKESTAKLSCMSALPMSPVLYSLIFLLLLSMPSKMPVPQYRGYTQTHTTETTSSACHGTSLRCRRTDATNVRATTDLCCTFPTTATTLAIPTYIF